jgi:peptide/nickel transport system ATP-binding protein
MSYNQQTQTDTTTTVESDANETLLSVDSLSVEFRTDHGTVKALRDVSLNLDRGETLGIAGESGSGKSTLALSIVRYLDKNGSMTNGSIRFKNYTLEDLSANTIRSIRGNELAHVPQDPEKSLNPSLTVGEQIKEVIELHQDVDNEGAIDRVHEVLGEVNIPDPAEIAARYPHELSGGQQQRVLLAMALSCNPDLLILDEPTTGLDVTTQAKILDLIDELKTEYGGSILLITHNLGVIARIADRVGILYAGEIMERGTVSDVFTEPANPYTQGLLASTPSLEEQKDLMPIPGQIPDLYEIPNGCIFADRCEFATDECRNDDIEVETVDEKTGHESRCRRWEHAVNNPIQATTESTSEQHTPGDSLIEFDNLKKHFGKESFFDRFFESEPSVRAVDGVDLDIAESETVGLVGESGCGKSTLGKTLLQLLEVTDGEVRFRGENVTELPEADLKEFRSECQVVFQNPDSSLNPQKTVYEILKRPLTLFTDLDEQARDERIGELLNQVNLGHEMAGKYPHELSGGEIQRVAIARAFAANPSFVVLDESVSALDVSVQASILNLLKTLRKDYDTSYLFISHDLSVINAIADRIAVMYLGNVVEVGSKQALFKPPYHPYTRALLSSSPTIDPDQSTDRIHLDGDVPSARNPPSGCSFHTRCPQKIGEICEREDPALENVDVSNDENHCIACHLDEEEMMQEIGSIEKSE